MREVVTHVTHSLIGREHSHMSWSDRLSHTAVLGCVQKCKMYKMFRSNMRNQVIDTIYDKIEWLHFLIVRQHNTKTRVPMTSQWAISIIGYVSLVVINTDYQGDMPYYWYGIHTFLLQYSSWWLGQSVAPSTPSLSVFESDRVMRTTAWKTHCWLAVPAWCVRDLKNDIAVFLCRSSPM